MVEEEEKSDMEQENQIYNYEFNLKKLLKIEKSLKWCFQTFRAMLSFMKFFNKINNNKTLFNHSIYDELDKCSGVVNDQIIT